MVVSKDLEPADAWVLSLGYLSWYTQRIFESGKLDNLYAWPPAVYKLRNIFSNNILIIRNTVNLFPE